MKRNVILSTLFILLLVVMNPSKATHTIQDSVDEESQKVGQYTGTVKFFNDRKGFGFITRDTDNKDIFVHVSGLRNDIREGEKVSFDIVDGPKGPQALNVMRI